MDERLKKKLHGLTRKSIDRIPWIMHSTDAMENVASVTNYQKSRELSNRFSQKSIQQFLLLFTENLFDYISSIFNHATKTSSMIKCVTNTAILTNKVADQRKGDSNRAHIGCHSMIIDCFIC